MPANEMLKGELFLALGIVLSLIRGTKHAAHLCTLRMCRRQINMKFCDKLCDILKLYIAFYVGFFGIVIESYQ